MSLPDSVLPPLPPNALQDTANALDFPCGPPASTNQVQKALEKKPQAFDALIKTLASCSASTFALAASLYKDAPRSSSTVEGTLAPEEPTGVLGDLHVQGDLEVGAPLVVVGNLTVDGRIRDQGPESKLVVVGEVRCRSLYTTGWITILGGLSVEHAVFAEYNDDSLEVIGPMTAGLIVSDDHLVSATRKMATRRPSQSGAWGTETFDARFQAHKQELAQLLVEGVATEDGVDGEKLTAQRPPWR